MKGFYSALAAQNGTEQNFAIHGEIWRHVHSHVQLMQMRLILIRVLICIYTVILSGSCDDACG
jgi:hypothetical protein